VELCWPLAFIPNVIPFLLQLWFICWLQVQFDWRQVWLSCFGYSYCWLCTSMLMQYSFDAPGSLMKFVSGMSTLVPLVGIFFGFFCYASLLEALVWPMVWMHQHGFVFYDLKTHHMAMHLYWLLVFVAVDMPCSIHVAFGSFVLARHWRVSLLYLLEPWSCCFMVPLVWSLFNIWPPSIEDFGPSLHFFVCFGYHCCLLDILALSFLCFCQVVCLVVKRCALIGFCWWLLLPDGG